MPPTNVRATVENIENLSFNVKHFRLKLVEPSVLPFTAGQFMIAHVPKDGKHVKRAYSIASAPHEEGILELCIQHVEGGAASTYFWAIKPGDTVNLSGPHGTFVMKEPFDYDPIFIATGTGVAPLRGMIKDLIRRNIQRTFTLFLGVRYEHAILYDSEFRQLAGFRPNFRYIPVVSRPKGWRGETGHAQEVFQKEITTFDDKEIYLCGWDVIVKAICKDLASYGVPSEKLHYEEWG